MFQIGQYTGVVMNRTVSLQTPGCIYNGIIMHELMHTLGKIFLFFENSSTSVYFIGFFHEQSRPDRDSYVKINETNIKASKIQYCSNESYSRITLVNDRYFSYHIDMLSQFSKYDTISSDTQGSPYDYTSVMHYQRGAFSANGSPTIEPLQQNVKIGQRYFLSPNDIATIQKFYGCSGVGPTLPATVTAAAACKLFYSMQSFFIKDYINVYPIRVRMTLRNKCDC